MEFAEEIGRRIRSAAVKKELLSPQSLAQTMTEFGFEIGAAGVKKHWYGKVVPNGVNCIGYSRVLGVSIDWLLTGAEPARKYTATELKAIVADMIIEAGGEIPDKDPTVAELTRLISKMETQDQRQMAIRVIKSMVGES